MGRTADLVRSHPRHGNVDADRYSSLIEELVSCEIACILGADACLSEPHVQMLAKCIALDMDCADSCAVALRTVARFGFQDEAVLRSLLEGCAEACTACARESDRHQHMEHCRLTAQACKDAEAACMGMLESLAARV